MKQFNDKHVVITGGGGGIGAEIARKFDEHGTKITLMGRTLSSLDETGSQLSQSQSVVCDVSLEESVTEAFSQATESFGPVDILINNAGIAESNPLHKTTLEQFMRILNVNLTGTFLCSRAVIKEMLDRDTGRIVNIASTAGLGGAPYITAYCASKHGVIGLTRALAMEVAKSDITVNAVCPGYTDTDMAQLAIDTIMMKTGMDEDHARHALVSNNPQGRMIEPDEVAETVIWLCSSGARSVTGQAIAISGGETQ